jgi:hypothetical protein
MSDSKSSEEPALVALLVGFSRQLLMPANVRKSSQRLILRFSLAVTTALGTWAGSPRASLQITHAPPTPGSSCWRN